MIRNFLSYWWKNIVHWKDLLNLWENVITWTLYFKLKVDTNLPSTEKMKPQIKRWILSQGTFWITQLTRKNFGDHPICMKYGYKEKKGIGCLLMFHNTYGMGKYRITIKWKYGKLDYTSSMGMSQERIWILDPIYPT